MVRVVNAIAFIAMAFLFVGCLACKF